MIEISTPTSSNLRMLTRAEGQQSSSQHANSTHSPNSQSLLTRAMRAKGDLLQSRSRRGDSATAGVSGGPTNCKAETMSTRSSSSAGVYLLSGCDGCILHGGHDKGACHGSAGEYEQLVDTLPSVADKGVVQKKSPTNVSATRHT